MDPDGREVEDDYKLTKKGEFVLVRKTKDNFDKVFAVGQNGEVNKNIYIIINKSIIEGLKKSHTVTVGDNLQNDVYKLFMFGANNTEVEWSAIRGIDKKGNNIFGVGTYKDKARAPGVDKYNMPYKNVVSFIHSHPSPNGGYKGEPKTMYGDRGVAHWYRVRNGGKIPHYYYVYMADSGRLWAINRSKDKIEFIRNTKYDYRRLFFGTLNSR